MKRTNYFKALLLAAGLGVGATSAWAVTDDYGVDLEIYDKTTYDFTTMSAISLSIDKTGTSYTAWSTKQNNYKGGTITVYPCTTSGLQNFAFEEVGGDAWQFWSTNGLSNKTRVYSAALTNLKNGNIVVFVFTMPDNKITFGNTASGTGPFTLENEVTVTTQTDIYNGRYYRKITMTGDGEIGFCMNKYSSSANAGFIRQIHVYKAKGTCENPSYEITSANGAKRTFQLSCTTTGSTIYYSTSELTSATGGTEYTEAVETEATQIWAYAKTATSTSDVIRFSTGAGNTLSLNTPTISFTGRLAQNGTYYYPVVTISSNNTSLPGNPAPTYTATLNGNAINVSSNTITLTEAGTLVVYGSASGYNNSPAVTFTGYAYKREYSLDLDDTEVTTAMGYTTPAGNGTYFGKEMDYYTLQSNITDHLDGAFAGYNLYGGYGIYCGSESSTGNQDLKLKQDEVTSDQIAHFVLGRFDSSNRWSASHTTHWTFATNNIRQTNSRMFLNLIELYSRANSEAVDAILDCKSYETSSAFATYINGLFEAGSLTTAAEVYAAHTAWQIENGTLNNGVRDITGTIRNAAVNDAAATDWAGAGTYSGEQYTGAPDIYFIDRSNSNMWATQTIYGLPAGTYYVKVATRAKAETYSHVYVSNGTEDIGRKQGNQDGNSGGTLGNGWSWTEVPFTLTATTDIILGFYAATVGGWASCDDWHLYKVEAVSATVGSTGYTTFASPYALDLSALPEGLTAYKASTVGETSVTFTPVETAVPAGTGLLLKGTTSTAYDIPVAASAEALTGNKLVGCTAETALTANASYYVMVNNGVTAEFQSLEDNGATIPAGKAYLNAAAAGARLSIVFDESTGISTVERNAANAEDYYNLSGQRVAQPTKGLYIVNGKKVVMK